MVTDDDVIELEHELDEQLGRLAMLHFNDPGIETPQEVIAAKDRLFDCLHEWFFPRDIPEPPPFRIVKMIPDIQ